MRFKKFLIISLLAVLLPLAGKADNNNWFIQADIGRQLLLAENFALRTDVITQSTNFVPSFAVGTWITPHLGFRLKGEGGNLHSFPAQTRENLGFRQEDFYLSAHLEALWNISPYLGLHRFNIVPFIGTGEYFRNDRGNEWDFSYQSPTSNYHLESVSGITIRTGLMLEYHLNERIGIYFNTSTTLIPNDKINRWYGGRPDALVAAAIGLTFNFGSSRFCFSCR